MPRSLTTRVYVVLLVVLILASYVQIDKALVLPSENPESGCSQVRHGIFAPRSANSTYVTVTGRLASILDRTAKYYLIDSIGPIELVVDKVVGNIFRYDGMSVNVSGYLTVVNGNRVLYVEKLTPVDEPRPMGIITGTRSVVVILVEFSDNTASQTVGYFQQLVFSQMNLYYAEVSYYSIQISGSVTSRWHKLSRQTTYYQVHEWGSSWWEYRKLASDVVALVDPYVNFASYQHVFMVFAGDWVWGCRGSLFGIPTWDGVLVNQVMFLRETYRMSTFAHEFGHDLGLPDLYDYDFQDLYAFVDSWDLMGINNAQHMSSYSKIYLGWIPTSRIRTVTSGTITETIERIEYPTAGYHTLRIQTSTNVYFLVETRQKIGYDANIPSNAPDHGVLITMIDETKGNGHGIVRLVDANPTTQSYQDGDAVWQVGQTYLNSAYGFSVTILSWSGTGFAVTVNFGTYLVHLESREDNYASWNKGTISSYPLPTDILKAAGSYPATYSPEGGYWFVRWETSGGVSVSNAGSQSTTVTVSSSGTLRAIYANPFSPLTVALISPSNGAVVSSSPVELKARVTSSGGNPQEATVKFYVDSSYVGSRNSDVNGYASYNYNPSSVKSYSWYVTAEKYQYDPGTSPTWTFTFSPISSRTVRVYSLPMSYLDQDPEAVKQYDVGASIKVDYFYQGQSQTRTSNTIFDVTADIGSTITFSVASAPSGWTFKSKWDHYRDRQYDVATLTIQVQSGSEIDKVAAFFEPISFSLSNSGGIIVTQGNLGSNTIAVTLVSGPTQTVTLSASGLPSGASASFNPSSGNPTFSSTCTISTSLSTPTGSYTITVTGTGGGLSRSTQFTLDVNPPYVPGDTWPLPGPPPTSGFQVPADYFKGWSRGYGWPTTAGHQGFWVIGNEISRSSLTSISSDTYYVNSYSDRWVIAVVWNQNGDNMQQVAFAPSGTPNQYDRGTIAGGSGFKYILIYAAPIWWGYPTGLTATPVSSSQINVAWTDKSDGENDFHIDRKTGDTGAWAEIGTVSAGVTSFPSTGLAPGTTYYYRVRAHRHVEGVYTQYSDTASGTTPGASFDFSMSNSGSITVTRGNSDSNIITVTLTAGVSQAVTLSASGLPSGAVASFNPPSGNPTFSSTCTISTSSSTPTGSYTINVTGTGGGLTRTTTFALTVNPPPPGFNFSLSNSCDITVAQGGSGSNTITVTLISGTSEMVALSDDHPCHIAFAIVGSFTPRYGYPTFTATFRVDTSASTPVGSYPITVIGTGGGVTRTTSFTLTITSSKGSTSLTLDASPKPGLANRPVTIFGVLYGTWRRIRGVVVGAPVEITTGWGFSTVVTTDNDGRFSTSTNCPSQGGTYHITAKFYEAEDLTGASTTIQYQVVAKIETTLSLSCVRISYGMGLAAKFYGFLTEKSSGAPVAGKTIHLTVFGGGSGWTYAVTTNSQGYYELVYTNNSGMFNWAEARFNGDDPYLPSNSGRIYG